MNFIYLSATKTLRFGDGPSLGRFTLGFADNAVSRPQFNGTFPFRDTRLSLMAAYESPLIAKRLGFVIDHLGGASELSQHVGRRDAPDRRHDQDLSRRVPRQRSLESGCHLRWLLRMRHDVVRCADVIQASS